MANPSKFYLSHMHARTQYRATWDPSKRLRIGDIGKLDQGVLNLYTSLDKEGIPAGISIAETGATMDYTSNDSVSISVKLAGAVPVAGSALAAGDSGFSFNFKGDQGIIFQTSNHCVHQLVNLAEIEDRVLEKYNNGNWEKDWVIITELITADAATIIISNSNNGALELKVNSALIPGKLTLTDNSLDLSVIREKGSTLKYIAQAGLTPLYRVMGLKSAFLSSLSISTKGYAAAKMQQERLEVLEFTEMEFCRTW